jgi:hypothetical protein
MRLLLFILLIPMICKAQAGAAWHCAYLKPKYGVLTESEVLTVAEKAAVAKDTLQCTAIRIVIQLSSWDGSVLAIDEALAKGLKVIPVLRYGGASPAPFVSADQLEGYLDTIDLVLDAYDFDVVVIGNEAINDNFNVGPLSLYEDMLQGAYARCRAKGVKVAESGIYGEGLDVLVFRWLKIKPSFGQDSAEAYALRCMSTAQRNAAQTPGSNPNIEAKALEVDSILSYRDYYDFANIHPYEVFDKHSTQLDTFQAYSTNVIKWQKDYIEERTKRLVITNEVGTRDNTDTVFLVSYMRELSRLKMPWIIYFNGGELPGEAEPLTDRDEGFLLNTGIAFRNFVSTRK